MTHEGNYRQGQLVTTVNPTQLFQVGLPIRESFIWWADFLDTSCHLLYATYCLLNDNVRDTPNSTVRTPTKSQTKLFIIYNAADLRTAHEGELWFTQVLDVSPSRWPEALAGDRQIETAIQGELGYRVY